MSDVCESSVSSVICAVVDRVEAGRSRRHALEEAGEKLARGVERAERLGVPPLEDEHRAEADDEQQAGHEQRQLRVQRPAPRPSTISRRSSSQTGKPSPPAMIAKRDRERDPAVRDEPIRLSLQSAKPALLNAVTAVEDPR